MGMAHPSALFRRWKLDQGNSKELLCDKRPVLKTSLEGGTYS